MTPAVVDAYRLPQLVRGWEAGLIRFLLARVTDSRSFVSRVAAAYHGREHQTQIEQLVDAVARHRIPVRCSVFKVIAEGLVLRTLVGVLSFALLWPGIRGQLESQGAGDTSCKKLYTRTTQIMIAISASHINLQFIAGDHPN